MKQKMFLILLILFMLIIAYAMRVTEKSDGEKIDGFFEEITISGNSFEIAPDEVVIGPIQENFEIITYKKER